MSEFLACFISEMTALLRFGLACMILLRWRDVAMYGLQWLRW